MRANPVRTNITMSPDELEALVRRVVREELKQLLRTPARSIADDWQHEGEDDPAGDAQLLTEALDVLRQHSDDSEAWMSWEDLEAQLDKS